MFSFKIPAIIAAVVTAATVGIAIGIVYAVAPLTTTDPCKGLYYLTMIKLNLIKFISYRN